MYSYTDFECLFVHYKLEGVPVDVSIEQFCLSNKVPYNLFAKWYKDTRKKIIPVQVLGAPSPEAEMQGIPSLLPEGTPEVATRLSSNTGLRILVDIRHFQRTMLNLLIKLSLWRTLSTDLEMTLKTVI